MKTLRSPLRVGFFAAVLAVFAVPISARADWKPLAGTYTGTWKSTDTDGKSYSGKATVKVVSGPGNKVKVTIKTALFGNPITSSIKSESSGKAAFSVTNPILGTVTGNGKATARGNTGKLRGSGPLYVIGTATLSATLKRNRSGLKASGTVVRAFPFVTNTLTFSFSGKAK
jgi:hypothetical protein